MERGIHAAGGNLEAFLVEKITARWLDANLL
jgi:hypothetical protein